jgi:hypothetical protein
VIGGEPGKCHLVLEARCETIIRCEALGEAEAARSVEIDQAGVERG